MTRLVLLSLAFFAWPGGPGFATAATPDDPPPSDARRPATDAELKRWLENMVYFHRFSVAEIEQATGLSTDEITAALQRFRIRPNVRPDRPAGAPLLVLPYPGGRHPRIGFLDGAVDPQRETKVSVFTPWDPSSYVVADVPEAVFSNLGLIYLAHTHVPTLWDQQEVKLPKLEWKVREDGVLEMERTLPNGIRLGTGVVPGRDAVRMEEWLTNGTKEPLTGLRVQNCVMLRGAKGFEAQTNDNKVFRAPFSAARSADGRRWIITAWQPIQRAWGNPPVPCLHSDPQFPDAAPGQTVRVKGWLSFFEGNSAQLDAELDRIATDPWWGKP